MHYTVIRINEVADDVAKALDYYESISVNLGIRFEDDLRRTFKKLTGTPHHYFNLRYGYRRLRLSSFPYMIVYRIDERTKSVKAIGLFHTHSKPSSIYRRAKGK